MRRIFLAAAAALATACNMDAAFNRSTASDMRGDLLHVVQATSANVAGLQCPPIRGTATRHANCEASMTSPDVLALASALGLAPATPSPNAQGHEGCPGFLADPSVTLYAKYGKDPRYAPFGFLLLYHRQATGEVCFVGTYPYG